MSLEKITKIIVETGGCEPEDVKPDAELVALGIDSLKAITVLFDLEEAYDIEIPNEIIPSILTVKDIQDNLAKKISK
jgi:acyl carrier protein